MTDTRTKLSLVDVAKKLSADGKFEIFGFNDKADFHKWKTTEYMDFIPIAIRNSNTKKWLKVSSIHEGFEDGSAYIHVNNSNKKRGSIKSGKGVFRLVFENKIQSYKKIEYVDYKLMQVDSNTKMYKSLWESLYEKAIKCEFIKPMSAWDTFDDDEDGFVAPV